MPNLSTIGLAQETTLGIRGVFSKHPEIAEAILYGSRALGNYRKGSDIDLTLVGEQLTLKKLLQIELELDELWLPYQFDISIFHQIENDALLQHIQTHGIILYQKP